MINTLIMIFNLHFIHYIYYNQVFDAVMLYNLGKTLDAEMFCG